MYDYGYDYGFDSYDYGSAVSTVGALAGVGIVMWIIGMAVAVFSIICMWKLFTKAGKKGWAAIVPIYNMIVMIEIAELPMWYIALFFVPLANIYAMFKIYIEIAHKFGKSTGFGIGMVFLNIIFIPMLAFGKAEYKGGAGVSVNNNVNPQPTMQPNLMNEQVNIPNNNLQSNIMDVNNGVGMQSVSGINMQSNGGFFQPVGNVNNNVQNMNFNTIESTSQNNVGVSSVNNTVVQPGNTNLSSPVSNVGVAPVNVQPSVNNMTKTCPNCGNQVDFNAMFCTNCGKNL